jgi:hypothetical protein
MISAIALFQVNACLAIVLLIHASHLVALQLEYTIMLMVASVQITRNVDQDIVMHIIASHHAYYYTQQGHIMINAIVLLGLNACQEFA